MSLENCNLCRIWLIKLYRTHKNVVSFTILIFFKYTCFSFLAILVPLSIYLSQNSHLTNINSSSTTNFSYCSAKSCLEKLLGENCSTTPCLHPLCSARYNYSYEEQLERINNCKQVCFNMREQLEAEDPADVCFQIKGFVNY